MTFLTRHRNSATWESIGDVLFISTGNVLNDRVA